MLYICMYIGLVIYDYIGIVMCYHIKIVMYDDILHISDIEICWYNNLV